MNLDYLDGLLDMCCWDLRPSNRPTTNDWKFSVQLQEATVGQPTRVIFNGPATIAFWPDGTKTIVKCQDGEPFDPEKGIAMAILKKLYGGGKYNNMLNTLIKNATYGVKEQ